MQANEYQEWTRTVAIYPDDQSLTYTILGLVSEAGEVADKWKKGIRDKNLDVDGLISEVADVAWYLARVSDELGVDLESLFQMNRDKLMSRKLRGTISGSGDYR